MLIVLGIAMIGAFLFSRAICGRSIARSPCAGGGGGDLTRTVDAAGRDEIADLLRALQTMQASLSEVVHEVRTHAEAVATARAEIARAITTCRRVPSRRPRRSRKPRPA
jgi:methyl-accepting chemotaxis protein-1 (serine sensor receptor)